MVPLNRRVFLGAPLSALALSALPAHAAPGTGVGADFPDVVYRTENGQTQSVSASRGKIAMVYLWAVWCPICYNDIVNIERIYQNLRGNPGFSPVVMNFMDDYRAGVAWARSRGITMPLFDSGMQTRGASVATTTSGPFQFQKYTPQFYVLDRVGRVSAATFDQAAGTSYNYEAIQKLLSA